MNTKNSQVRKLSLQACLSTLWWNFSTRLYTRAVKIRLWNHFSFSNRSFLISHESLATECFSFSSMLCLILLKNEEIEYNIEHRFNHHFVMYWISTRMFMFVEHKLCVSMTYESYNMILYVGPHTLSTCHQSCKKIYEY